MLNLVIIIQNEGFAGTSQAMPSFGVAWTIKKFEVIHEEKRAQSYSGCPHTESQVLKTPFKQTEIILHSRSF